MKCPLCNIEMRIDHGADVLKGNALYSRIFYKCRTKGCANYDKIVKTEDIPSERPLLVESEVEDE